MANISELIQSFEAVLEYINGLSDTDKANLYALVDLGSQHCLKLAAEVKHPEDTEKLKFVLTAALLAGMAER